VGGQTPAALIGATRSENWRVALSLSATGEGRDYRTTVGVHSKFETKSTSRTERPHRVSGENSTISLRSRISIHRSIGQALDDPRLALAPCRASRRREPEDPRIQRHPTHPRDPFGSANRRAGREGGGSGSAGDDPCEDPRGSAGVRARARAGVPGGPRSALFVP